jgi:FkbM family methyltransferase
MTSLWPESFHAIVAPNHCEDVLLGCYSIPVELDAPVILDIGANIGAFARWAVSAYPKCKLHCYEPDPTNFTLLRMTIHALPPPAEILAYNCGVMDVDRQMTLYAGPNNCGECSLYPTYGTRGTAITVVDAEKLPSADILKLDTEGAEPTILKRLGSTGKLANMKAAMLEWHRHTDRDELAAYLEAQGFTKHSIADTPESGGNRGVMKFIRKQA